MRAMEREIQRRLTAGCVRQMRLMRSGGLEAANGYELSDGVDSTGKLSTVRVTVAVDRSAV